MTNAEYLKVLRKEARERGDCYMCRARPAAPGRSNCATCLDAIRAKAADNVRAGRCACGKKRRRGKASCETCARINERANKMRKQRRDALGLCQQCKQPALPNRKTCETHRLANNARQRARDRRLKKR